MLARAKKKNIRAALLSILAQGALHQVLAEQQLFWVSTTWQPHAEDEMNMDESTLEDDQLSDADGLEPSAVDNARCYVRRVQDHVMHQLARSVDAKSE
eukprot:302438-Amphidinium_carterae.1